MMQQRRQQPSMIGELSTLLMWVSIAAVVISLVVWFNREPAPQQQPSLADIQASARWANFRGWALLIGGVSAGLVIIVGAVALCIRFLSGALDHWRSPPVVYPKNGSNGVAVITQKGYDEERHRVHRTVVTDLDTLNGASFSLNGKTEVNTFGHEDPHMRGMVQGQAIQQRHNTAREKQQAKNAFVSGQSQRAGKAPTKAEIHYDVDAAIKNEQLIRERAKTTKLLSKTDDVVGQEGDVEREPVRKKPAITAIQALSFSDEEHWIVGQDSSTGVCFPHEPKSTPHIALHGASGEGKTAGLAFAIIAHARKFNWHVIVLDGKGGLDFAENPQLESVYEWHDLKPDNVLPYVQQLTCVMEYRMTMLTERNVRTLSKLHESAPASQGQYPNILVVWEELGAVVDALRHIPKGDRGVKPFNEFETLYSNLLRLARAAGIHMLMIDQDRDKWSASMKTNARAIYTFRLGGFQGQSIAPQAPLDIPRHHFWNNHNNRVYSAWNWADVDLYNQLGPQQSPRILETRNTLPVEGGARVLPPPSGNPEFQGVSRVSSVFQGVSKGFTGFQEPAETQDGNLETKNETRLSWKEIRQLGKHERQGYLQSISLRMDASRLSGADRAAVYAAYMNLGENKSDTCYYAFGYKGRNYGVVSEVLKEYQ